MSRVLIFRPFWEAATAYGNVWLGEILKISQGLGHEVVDLSAENATKENLLKALQEFKPEILFLCSHGSPTQFSGQGGTIVFTACVNDQAMTGTQAMFLSCLVGQELLPSMDQKDAVTVAGYVSEFVWVINSDYAERIVEDPYAYPFMRAVVEPARRLLQGGSWREWYDYTVSFFNQGVAEWFESQDPSAAEIVSALEHDRDSLVVYGETAISPIAPPVAIPGPIGIIMPISVGVTLVSLIV